MSREAVDGMFYWDVLAPYATLAFVVTIIGASALVVNRKSDIGTKRSDSLRFIVFVSVSTIVYILAITYWELSAIAAQESISRVQQIIATVGLVIVLLGWGVASCLLFREFIIRR